MYIFDIAKAFKTDISKDKAIDTLFWDFVNSNGNKKSVMLPCSTFALGNSMVFTANFKDNLSAGLCISSVDDWLCEDVFIVTKTELLIP